MARKISTGFLSGNLIPGDGIEYDEIALADDYRDRLIAALAVDFPSDDIVVDYQSGSGSPPTGLLPSIDGEIHTVDVAHIQTVSEDVYEQTDWDRFTR